jgi:hypothetical protein
MLKKKKCSKNNKGKKRLELVSPVKEKDAHTSFNILRCRYFFFST